MQGDFRLTLQSSGRLASNKSLRPDGVVIEFYKKLWPTIGRGLNLSMLQEAIEIGRFHGGVLEGLIALIHKGGERDTLNNYRPITLPNIGCKVFAKAI